MWVIIPGVIVIVLVLPLGIVNGPNTCLAYELYKFLCHFCKKS